MSAHGRHSSRRLTPNAQTPLQAACWHLVEAFAAAQADRRTFEAFVSIAIERLSELPPALARMVVVRLAEQAAGTYVPQAGERVGELIELGRRGGRRELHLGGQAGAVIQGGVLEMVRLPPRARRS